MRETFGNILLCKYSGAVKIIAQIPRLGQKEFTWGGGNGDLTCSCHVPLLCWNFFRYSSYAHYWGNAPFFQSPKQLHDGLSTPVLLYCLIACYPHSPVFLISCCSALVWHSSGAPYLELRSLPFSFMPFLAFSSHLDLQGKLWVIQLPSKKKKWCEICEVV